MHPTGRRVLESFVLRTVWLSLVALLAVALVNRVTPATEADLSAVEPEIMEPFHNESVVLDVSRLVARPSTLANGEKRLTFFGVVHNPVASNVDSLTVTISISDGETVAATIDGTPAAKAIPASGSIPFRLSMPRPAKWKAAWPIAVTAAGRTTDTPIADMSLTNLSTTTGDDRKIHVRGTVRNASDWATGDSLFWVTLLNPAGGVVTAGWRPITRVIGPQDSHEVEIVMGPVNGWTTVEAGVLDRFLTY